MSQRQLPCSALDWKSEFQFLLNEMITKMHLSQGAKKIHLARYLTAIACGGYFGPRAKELLNLHWFDVINKRERDVFEFKTEKRRKIYFNEKLIRLINSNYEVVDPDNIHEFILPSPRHPGKPISTRSFNKSFQIILKELGIQTDNPSSHTLRKTFALRAFKNKGSDENALSFVSDLLNHTSPKVTRTYLGLKKREVQEAYVMID
jgi:integrase